MQEGLASRMRLVVIEVPGLPAGATQAQEFDFEADPYRSIWVVGRQLGSNIHLVDPSVSRNHAELTITPDGLLVRDLGSANGTYINDQPLLSEDPALLRPGDRLRIGNVVTLLEAGSMATQPAGPQSSYGEYPAQPRIASLSPRGQLPPTKNLQDPAETLKRSQQPAPPQSIYTNPAAAQPPVRPVEATPSPVYQPINQSYQEPPRYQPQPAPVYQRPPANNQNRPAPPPSLIMPPQPQFAPAPVRPVPPRPAPVQPRRRSRLPLWLALGLLLLVALSVGGYFLYNNFNQAAAGLPVGQLPASVFNSPANNENALGLAVSRPSAWKRNDVDASQTLFYQPDNPTMVINIEKPPGHTIIDPNLSPEGAVRQYLANVKANSTKAQLPASPETVVLKDGTPGVIARLTFSTTGTPAVNDYTMTVLSFKCGPQLYFASAAAEAKDYNPYVRQDLDAAIANMACAK